MLGDGGRISKSYHQRLAVGGPNTMLHREPHSSVPKTSIPIN